MRVLPFTKYSPCGNTTILVRESSLSPADRARVAAEIIAPGHLEAEQAGYVDTAAPVPRLDMMGGEFCVNATRAFAALLAEEGKLSPESGGLGGIVSVSGMPERLRVRVRRLAAHRFESSVLLDLPQAPPLENVAPGMYLVRVPGIAHLVLDAAAHPLPADKDRDTAALFARFGLLGEDAAGCIWLHREPSGLRITPFVWVRGTGTTYAETACGSGTLAAYIVCRGVYGDGGELSLMQPGGEPLRVVPDGSAYPGGWAAWVGGPVRRIARGDVFVECLDGEGRTGGREGKLSPESFPSPSPVSLCPSTSPMIGVLDEPYEVALAGSPVGGDEFAGGGIGDDSVDDDVGAQLREGIHGKLDVGVLRQRDVLSGAVGPLERRVPADIDVVQLDPVDGQGVEAADGGVHVVRGFTGKAEHEVRADLHVGFFRQLNGLGRGRRVVPPVDAAQGGVVQRLDAKLKPFFFPRRGAEDSHFFRIEAVGPGSHGNPGEIGQGAENLQHRREPGGGAVGIGKGLQIREEQRGPVGLAEVLAPVLPLGGEVHSGKAEPRAGTYGVAEGAARAGERPVTVGAACPRVERDLLDPLAEALAEMDGECIPCMHQNGPFGRIAANAVAVHIF